jgi:hypothetical protein
MEIKGIQVHSCSSAHHTAPSSNVLKDDETAWNAGCHPPAWITLELKEDAEIDGIMLLPEMTPNRADVVHEVRAGLSSQNMHAVERFSGTAISGVWIALDLPKIDCRYVEIRTLSSPSWVSWRQIRIFGLERKQREQHVEREAHEFLDLPMAFPLASFFRTYHNPTNVPFCCCQQCVVL